MPRESSISSADHSTSCPTCTGTGQVRDISDVDETFTLIPCPFCNGIGRVVKGRGNNKKLKAYNSSQVKKLKNKNFLLFQKSLRE